jgi:hypothetical protein
MKTECQNNFTAPEARFLPNAPAQNDSLTPRSRQTPSYTSSHPCLHFLLQSRHRQNLISFLLHSTNGALMQSSATDDRHYIWSRLLAPRQKKENVNCPCRWADQTVCVYVWGHKTDSMKFGSEDDCRNVLPCRLVEVHRRFRWFLPPSSER